MISDRRINVLECPQVQPADSLRELVALLLEGDELDAFHRDAASPVSAFRSCSRRSNAFWYELWSFQFEKSEIEIFQEGGR
jgi:hypothetical protein